MTRRCNSIGFMRKNVQTSIKLSRYRSSINLDACFLCANNIIPKKYSEKLQGVDESWHHSLELRLLGPGANS